MFNQTIVRTYDIRECWPGLKIGLKRQTRGGSGSAVVSWGKGKAIEVLIVANKMNERKWQKERASEVDILVSSYFSVDNNLLYQLLSTEK